MVSVKGLAAFGVILWGSVGCAGSRSSLPPLNIVQADRLQWGALNPARGDASPQAANLWGDRTEPRATGFLVRFRDGFSSPPHIHNVSYRAFVIRGQIYNGPADAEKVWMAAGSYWTQPKGAVHITSAKGEGNMIYVEIDEGPYLVYPPAKAFATEEVAVNLEAADLDWEPSPVSGVDRVALDAVGTQARLYGSILKLPSGFRGRLTCSGKDFRAVVLGGTVMMGSPQGPRAAGPGSGLHASQPFSQSIEAESPSLLYIRSDVEYQVLE